MSFMTLAFTLSFVLVALFLSTWLKLGMDKDILLATVRASIQLILVGYLLRYVFGAKNSIFMISMVLLMIAVATWNVNARVKHIQGTFWRIALALTATEVITQALLLSLHIVPFAPRYVISISGMLVGNAMVASSLLLNRLQSEVQARRSEIETILALGGTPKQAIYLHLKQAIRAGMIPTIDSTKTTGLVQLPGMMTGQIIAGANPVQAVKYQLMILFCILAGSTITCIILGFLTYPQLFNNQLQLVYTPDSRR
jgi:putative ABC transport system permease protein